MKKNKTVETTIPLSAHSYLECKALYIYLYDEIPCLMWVDKVNVSKALAFIKSEYADVITAVYQYSKLERKKGKMVFDTTFVLLRDNLLIELASDYCEVLYAEPDYQTACILLKELSRFKKIDKQKEFEINLISKGNYGLELKGMEIKKTKLDLALYYEDEFLAVDKIIRNRLSKKGDKGIVLLHGLPGTGKTTYLRYLVGKLKKKILFMSPSIAGSILDPGFMDLLIDNPDCIVIIEDAENVILDRRVNSDSAVSNLLNISDGLLSDFLSVQVICTFNHPLSMVDEALMRKGRLIAKYEFGKLGIIKAQRLSDQFGFDTVIKEPMTIAAIANQHEQYNDVKRAQVMGFRRNELQMN